MSSTFNLKDDLTLRSLLIRIAIVVGTVAVIVLTMPNDSSITFFSDVGKPWRYADLTASFDFPIYKSEKEVKTEQDSVKRAFEPYYNYINDEGGAQVSRFSSDFAEGMPDLEEGYISIIANRLTAVYKRGIIASSEYADLLTDSMKIIRVVTGKKASSVKVRDLYSEKSAYEQLFKDETTDEHRQALQKCNLSEYITANLIYDEEKSDAALTDELNTIPQASGVVQQGQKIIGRGDIITEEVYQILESYKIENERRNKDTTQIRLTMFGHVLYVSLFMICFTIYITLFRKDYFEKYRNVAMLYALIVIFTLLTSLMISHNFGHVYIIPYAMVPIFVRIFLDSRTAFITHFTLTMICACMVTYQLQFVAIQTLSGLAAIYSLRELQYRSQIFKTAVIVCLVEMAVNACFDLIMASSLDDISSSTYQYIVANCIMLLFVYPLLYLMEKAFGFISDITLIELSNTNNDMLRKLSEVAPGTFQHSITVGNLAAAVANKIGAKGQLVRTGALYHDIGKMTNPIYFTENQSGVNPHASLSYIDSAQMIISHVTEGMKLAEKVNLPKIIKDFICTHHGLGKAKYFYIKYKEEHPDEDVDMLLFTYIGPNPFTREQAILMMADSVEAASRSLPDYTDKSIRELVNRIVDGQQAEGFFRECPITFRDIAYAKTVLIDKLKSIYHTRVAYPAENKS